MPYIEVLDPNVYMQMYYIWCVEYSSLQMFGEVYKELLYVSCCMYCLFQRIAKQMYSKHLICIICIRKIDIESNWGMHVKINFLRISVKIMTFELWNQCCFESKQLWTNDASNQAALNQVTLNQSCFKANRFEGPCFEANPTGAGAHDVTHDGTPPYCSASLGELDGVCTAVLIWIILLWN